MKRFLKRAAIVLAVAFVLIQVVRPALDNPPVDPSKTLGANAEMPARVAAIVGRSCADCHSNETRWPWYSQIAPASWLMSGHIHDGRRGLNFSTWADYEDAEKLQYLRKICDQAKRDIMPLSSYLLLHGDARLSDEDKAALCEWVTAERARIQGRQ